MIPFETAHIFLEAFGINRRTEAYERWERPDGFREEDFGEVLCDSPFWLTVDWRASIDEIVVDFAKALKAHGHELKYKLTEGDENSAEVQVGNLGPVSIVYSPNEDEGDLSALTAKLVSVLPTELELRASISNSGSDTGVFAILKIENWKVAESTNPSLLASMFSIPIAPDA